MNDTLLLAILGLIVTLITIVTPVIKLNTNITTLTCTIDALSRTITRDEDELKNVKETTAQHELDIGNIKKDVKILYKKTDDLENRKE